MIDDFKHCLASGSDQIYSACVFLGCVKACFPNSSCISYPVLGLVLYVSLTHRLFRRLDSASWKPDLALDIGKNVPLTLWVSQKLPTGSLS